MESGSQKCVNMESITIFARKENPGREIFFELRDGDLNLVYNTGMELSERCIETLEKEGFPYVYEWKDGPNTAYLEHVHQGKVSIFITEGGVEFTLSGVARLQRPGDRFNVPPGLPYSAQVGGGGCQYVIGEMIDGDFKVS